MQDVNLIISNNIGLIKAQLKKLCLFNDPEAESIGYEALYTAIETFDVTKGYKLSTYATCCIYNALGSYIRTLNKKRQLDVISYNNVAYNEDGVQHEFLEFFEAVGDVESEYMKCELCNKVREVYLITYDKLTNDKHKAIIKAWHDSEYTMMNKEIATIVGVSQPYVNQVINTFKFSLRKRLEAYYYE